MKIGVIFCGYNTESSVASSLEPWTKLRLSSGHTIRIIGVSVPFKEYKELKLPPDGTTFYLQNALCKCEIDGLITQPGYIKESEARNLALEQLQDSDLIITVDSDEIYSQEEILKAIEFIEDDEFSYSYSVYFKNFVFDGSQYYEQKFPNRFFRAKNVKRFFYDCDVIYDINGKLVSYKDLPQRDIPSKILKVKHLTWLNDNRSKHKVEYQIRHFGHCSFQWNHTKNQLEFNDEYYKKTGQPKPVLIPLDQKTNL